MTACNGEDTTSALDQDLPGRRLDCDSDCIWNEHREGFQVLEVRSPEVNQDVTDKTSNVEECLYYKGSKYRRKARQRLTSLSKVYAKCKRKRATSSSKMGSGCSRRSKIISISSDDPGGEDNPEKRAKISSAPLDVPTVHFTAEQHHDIIEELNKENTLPSYSLIFPNGIYNEHAKKNDLMSDETEVFVAAEPGNISIPVPLDQSTKFPRTHSWDESTLKHSIGHTNLKSVKQSFSQLRQQDPSANNNNSLSMRRSSSDEMGLKAQSKLRQSRKPTTETSVVELTDNQVNQYTIMEEIGRGSFGAVHKCFSSKDNTHYAMKILSRKRLIRKSGLVARHPRNRKSTNLLDSLHREVAILKKVDHPNIVRLVEVLEDPQVDNVYLVFDLVEQGPVIDLPSDVGLHEETARCYFRDIILGIEYLHYSKIIHRDIKPSNLLLGDNDTVKLADFGVSNMFEDEDDHVNKFEGSPAFQAPETINEHRNKYSGKAADIWALGITLYSFIYGQCPFFSTDIVLLFHRIKSLPVPFLDGVYINPQLQDLISRMLSKNPAKRITLDEIKDHPWLTRGGSEPLPSTYENCTLIEVTEEEVKNSVTLISRLSSLVAVKTMLRKRTFSRSKQKAKSTNSL